MRAIKFRAWRPSMQEMMVPLSLSEIVENLYLDSDIQMQYTGLKDKNGVEIYEGDIINDYLVVIEPLGVGLRNRNGEWEGRLSHRVFEIQVVGNIYENPELLSPTAQDGEKEQSV